MTKRRYLSPKQRQDMLEAQHGKCACNCGCQDEITVKASIGEHTWCVAHGNDQKPDRLLCLPCADVKTNGNGATTYGSDSHEIAKATRYYKERVHGIPRRKRKGPPMQSRGFDKSLRKKMDGTVVRV